MAHSKMVLHLICNQEFWVQFPVGQLNQRKNKMNNNLKKAKEIEERLEAFKKTKVRDFKLIKSKLNEIKKVKKQAEDHLKKVEKGCGKRYLIKKVEGAEIWEECGHLKKYLGINQLCPDCQKAIKICEGIIND